MNKIFYKLITIIGVQMLLVVLVTTVVAILVSYYIQQYIIASVDENLTLSLLREISRKISKLI